MTYLTKYGKTGVASEEEELPSGSLDRNDYRRTRQGNTELMEKRAKRVNYMSVRSGVPKLDLGGFELKPVRYSADPLDVSQRTTQFISPVESLNGMVVRIEEQNAIIEFTKGVNTVHRSIGLTTLQELCEHKISPGDRVALRTYRAGRNCFQTMWRYLGKGTVKLTAAQADHLDELHRNVHKKRP